jgi:hypothetical protein
MNGGLFFMNKPKTSAAWWVYQIHQVYLKRLYLNEIDTEQYNKDLKFLKNSVNEKIAENEKLTFDEFLERVFGVPS